MCVASLCCEPGNLQLAKPCPQRCATGFAFAPIQRESCPPRVTHTLAYNLRDREDTDVGSHHACQTNQIAAAMLGAAVRTDAPAN